MKKSTIKRKLVGLTSGGIKIDPALDKLSSRVLFPAKLARAEAAIQLYGIPDFQS